MTMPCVSDKPCNCEKGCSCEDGYECCTQKGNEGRLGMCVDKKCACNRNLGFPDQKSRRDLSPNASKILENFSMVMREGFDGTSCDCSDWKNAFFVLILLIIILVGVIVFMKKDT
jgi:hypothetical protein